MPMVSGTGFVQDAAIAIVDSISFQRSHEEFLHQAPHKPVEITRRGRREFVLMNIEHHDWFRTTSLRRHRTAEAAAIVIDAVERAAMNAGLMPLDAPLGQAIRAPRRSVIASSRHPRRGIHIFFL